MAAASFAARKLPEYGLEQVIRMENKYKEMMEPVQVSDQAKERILKDISSRLEKKRRRRKRLRVLFPATVAAAVCVLVIGYSNLSGPATDSGNSLLAGSQVTAEARVRNDLDHLAKYDSKTITSSNPYDYTKNKYYKDLVSMGMDAVPVLAKDFVKKMETSSDSFAVDGYVAALAVEDITDVDLQTLTGKDPETAEEYWTAWDQFLRKMPSDFEAILKNGENLKTQLKSYGLFGEVLASAVVEKNDGSVKVGGQKIDYNKNSVDVKSLKSMIRSSRSEIRKADSFLENYYSLREKLTDYLRSGGN